MTVTVGTQELAALFRVTPKTVRGWMRDGMPVVVEGSVGAGNEAQIDLASAVRWYVEKNATRFEVLREQARLTAERADQIAMANAERRKDLARTAVVEKQFATAADYARRVLLAIPKREAPAIAAESDPVAIQAHLTAAIHAALHELANYATGGSSK